MVKLSSNNYFLLFLGIVVIMDSQAFKRQLSFKDALLNKYSLEEDDEELCFIHISGSPKHKGKRVKSRQVNFYLNSHRIIIINTN